MARLAAKVDMLETPRYAIFGPTTIRLTAKVIKPLPGYVPGRNFNSAESNSTSGGVVTVLPSPISTRKELCLILRTKIFQAEILMHLLLHSKKPRNVKDGMPKMVRGELLQGFQDPGMGLETDGATRHTIYSAAALHQCPEAYASRLATC